MQEVCWNIEDAGAQDPGQAFGGAKEIVAVPPAGKVVDQQHGGAESGQQGYEAEGHAAGALPVGIQDEDGDGQSRLFDLKCDEPHQHGEEDGRAASAVDGEQEQEDEERIDAAEVEPSLRRHVAGGVETGAGDCSEAGPGFAVDECVDDAATAQCAEDRYQAQGGVSGDDHFAKRGCKVEVERGVEIGDEVCGRLGVERIAARDAPD